MSAANGSTTCTTVGYAAGGGLTTGGNCLLLGYNAGSASSPGGLFDTESNKIVLGNNSIQNFHVAVDPDTSSDVRDKTDFTALDLGLDFVNDLNPITYRWDKRSYYLANGSKDLSSVTPDGTHKEDKLCLGFKAQEVEALEIAAGYSVANDTNLLVSVSKSGDQYGLTYSRFVPILVKAVQELSAEIDKLKGLN